MVVGEFMKKGIVLLFILFSPFVGGAPPSKAPEIAPLIEALGNHELHVQIDAMLKLEEIGKPAVPSLLRHLNTENQIQKWRVLHLLAKQKRKEVIPILKKMLKDPSTRSKRTLFLSSIYSLAWVSGSEETAFLLDKLKPVTSRDTDMILMGVLSLHKIAKTDLAAFLEGAYLAGIFLETSESPRLKMVSDAIKNLPMTESKILHLFRQKNAAKRAGALFILRTLKPYGAESYFLQGFRDKNNPSVFTQATLGIGEYKKGLARRKK